MRRILKELLHEQKEEIHIFHDNKYAIALSRNHVFHNKCKHIYMRYHFIRELVTIKDVWSSTDQKTILQTYLQNPWEKNCLKLKGKA